MLEHGLDWIDGYLNPMKVVLHPAELGAPREQEDRPDDHHADLVQDRLGRGGQILGHTHSYGNVKIVS